MNKFEKVFMELAKRDDPLFIWRNWMDWVIDANLIAITDRKLDFHNHEKEYFELYCAWVELIHEYQEKHKDDPYTYYDYLGAFFEEHLITKFNKKNDNQFFTPSEVSKVMAQLTVPSGLDNTQFIYDCACGSARLLLDGHRESPDALVIGWDYDSIASRMAVLNLYIHGLRGSVLHMNSLTLEFFEAWRINNYLGYGLPVPHIELVSESEAYRFIGRNLESGKKEVVTAPEPPLEPVVSKPKTNTLEAWL